MSVNYKVVENNQDVIEACAILAADDLLSVDTENSGLDPRFGRAILAQIATQEICFIFPGYKGLDFSPLKKVLENKKIKKLLFNAKYDWKWLKFHYDIALNNIYDAQIAERLLTVGMPNSRRRPSLVDVADKYTQFTITKEVRSSFINRDPVAFPITEKEHEYSAKDTFVLFDVYLSQVPLLVEDGLDEVAQLEFDNVPILANGELLGIKINTERWRSLVLEASKKCDKVAVEINKHFSKVIPQKNLFSLPAVNLGSPAQLKKVLIRLGFDIEDTNEKVLKKYVNKHEIFELLLRHRGLGKIVNAYGESLLAKINIETSSLHTEFNQVQADTGRMSSQNPNLQQVPKYNAKDPDSLDFRSCFVARPGYKLITADFSQQELRILADMSKDLVFSKAYLEVDEEGNELDVHRYTASVVFGVPYSEVSSAQRDRGKTLNFFLVYGGGPSALAENLKISEDEARNIINDFFSKFRMIKSFLNKQAERTVEDGFITTISGRRRYLPVPPESDPKHKKFKSKAERQGKNTKIQGSGADVTKKAIVLVDEKLRAENYDANILLVVHDEIVVEVREDQAHSAAKIVEEKMCEAFSYYFKRIPMRVDAHISDVWNK